MKLIQVKEFNRLANIRCDKDVEDFRGNAGFPHRPMYVFQTPEGNERTKGWVATEENKHCFGMNENKAIALFNK